MIPLKSYMTALLTLISICGILALAFIKNVDIQILLPTILGIYVGGKTTQKVSAHINADNGEKAKVIDKLDEA